MASILKQRYTTIEPETGRRIRRKSACWYVDYKAADGTRKRVKGFRDKQATVQLAAKLEKEAELARAGIIDKYKDHRSKPLLEHLADFKANLLDKGNTVKHAQLVYNRAKAVVDGCRFCYFSDISASKVQSYLADRRRQGLSIRSSNFYLQAIKQFCRWMVADNRVGENPLAHLQGQNPKTDIRHQRRALTAEELQQLLIATRKGPTHCNMTGKERAMLYFLAVNTGLRASEIASLTWGSFSLDGSETSVTISAAYSKHRKEDILPLRRDVAESFAIWRRERQQGPQDKVFAGFNPNKGAKMLRRDLDAAGIPYQDSSGRVADFHSLRHTFISNLSRSGVSPKVAQSLARHSTIGLTMDTYTHVGLYDERAALELLPTLPTQGKGESGSSAAAVAKTGTDDLPLRTDKGAYQPAYKKLTKNAFPARHTPATIGNESAESTGKAASCKSLPSGTLGSNLDQMAPDCATEQEGFEPPGPFGPTVFKTAALSRSATAPTP